MRSAELTHIVEAIQRMEQSMQDLQALERRQSLSVLPLAAPPIALQQHIEETFLPPSDSLSTLQNSMFIEKAKQDSQPQNTPSQNGPIRAKAHSYMKDSPSSSKGESRVTDAHLSSYPYTHNSLLTRLSQTSSPVSNPNPPSKDSLDALRALDKLPLVERLKLFA
jgi:hypothetical protein